MNNKQLIGLILIIYLGIGVFLPTVLNAQEGNPSSPPLRVLEVDKQPKKAKKAEERVESVNRILAMVGDHVVTMNQYRKRYGDTTLSRERLNPLVNEILLQAAADAKKLSPSEDQVQSVIQRQMDQIKSRGTQQFERILQVRGITEDEYKDQLREKARMQMLETRVLGHYFPSIRQSDTRAAQTYARARLMLIDDVSTAWQVYSWLKGSPTERTWNKLFKRYSDKLSLMGKHGDLGWFRWGYYGDPIEYRVYSLPLYTVSRPFRFRDYYAIVYPTGYRIARYGESSSDVFRKYQQFRRRSYRERLFDRLRSEYTVVYPSEVRKKLDLDGRT